MRVPDKDISSNANTELGIQNTGGLKPRAGKQTTVRVGTRGSRLAIVQTGLVVNALKLAYPDVDFQIVTMSTRGDRDTSRALLEFGGKAVFVEEFEEAIRKGDIDLAVHSAKDMPMDIMEGLAISGTLRRACPQDVLIYKAGRAFDMEDRLIVGTSSLRRRYQIKQMYPEAECRSLRGNINTRLDKLKNGEYDAIILAAAGIERLGIVNGDNGSATSGLTFRYLSTEEMVPAACQGIIAIETKDSGEIFDMVKAINDKEAYTQLLCERQVLRYLNAGCHEPIGVYSELSDDTIKLSLMKVEAESGRDIIKKTSVKGQVSRWQKLAEELAVGLHDSRSPESTDSE